MHDNAQQIREIQQQIDRLNVQIQQLALSNVKTAASQTTEYIGQVADNVKGYTGQMSDYLQDQGEAAKQRAIKTGRQVNDYVQENPWQVVGMVAGVAALAGIAITLLIQRDRD